MQLLLIRHGEPIRVGEGGVEGPADPPLSERGRDQAERVGTWLAVEGVDHVVSSPMVRAVQTAAPLASILGLEVEVVDDLAEFDRHAGHYIPVEELKANRDPRLAQMAAGDFSAYGEGDPEAFVHRVRTAMDAVIAGNPGRKVAVVCHGGVINVFTAGLAGTASPLWFDATYTGISRINASRSGIRTIASINETAHLR